ncbi:MAG: cobalamin-dependent protein [Planctomycetes bacterium]|nr:cobalamin-dependent protein [Planctomycetota bacterium]
MKTSTTLNRLPEPGPATTPAAVRIVLAKVGLDGHDRGIKVVARGLRDAGLHVIYGGIWQSPEAVAQATLDEDARWLGISLLNGAHLTLIPQVIDALRRRGLDDVGVILGGIVPPRDIPALNELGVSGVFGPGTSVDEIARFLKSPPTRLNDAVELVSSSQQRDRRALSRLLSLIAEGRQIDTIRDALATCTPGHGQTAGPTPVRTVAFTGNAGVGKSSLIARVVTELRSRQLTVAVLSCDPQSPVTGGALLGDRIRMSGCLPDEGVFVRSLPVPSGSQGIAAHLDLMTRALAGFGFDVVLIETAGTGQGDVAVRAVADSIVLVLQPETGDSVQWEKAGLLEIADVIVINKSELPGAERMESELREHLNLSGPAQRGPNDSRHGSDDVRRGSDDVRRGSPDPAETPDRRSPLHQHLVQVSAARNEGIQQLWKILSGSPIEE